MVVGDRVGEVGAEIPVRFTVIGWQVVFDTGCQRPFFIQSLFVGNPKPWSTPKAFIGGVQPGEGSIRRDRLYSIGHGHVLTVDRIARQQAGAPGWLVLQLPAESQRQIEDIAVIGSIVGPGSFIGTIVAVIILVLVGAGINPVPATAGLQEMALAHVVLQDAFDSLNPQIFPFEFREDIRKII